MKTLDTKNYQDVIVNIECITGKIAPDITINLCDNAIEFVSEIYGEVDFIPDFVRVLIDYEKNIITTFDKCNINLYLFFLIHGKFCNMHPEWHKLISCYAKHGFCSSSEIAITESLPFPQLLFASECKLDNAKAYLFATMVEHFGFQKMVDWLESPDLLFYYEKIFDVACEKHIEPFDISSYEKILKGEAGADEDTRLALWIDDKYRKDSKLEVFYSSPDITKAAIKYHDSVLGIANIINGAVASYVTDYSAWERRRAEGYTRSNPYNETEFMEKVLSYTDTENPKILEIGIGGGRKAKPFVQKGIEYYGVDISDGMLGECMATLGMYKNLNIQNHNIYNGLPFKDNFFDILIECRVISGMVTNPFLMSEINRVLRPGGVAFVDISDNNSLYEQNSDVLQKQDKIVWDLFKPTYFSYFNITDKRIKNQPQFGLELPKPRLPKCPQSTYIIPASHEVFTKERPFSLCKHEHDYIQESKDNKYHMAFFRTEPMFEPCGTDFFHALEQSVRQSFGNIKGKTTLFTALKVYKF